MRAPEPDCWLHPDVRVDASAIAGRGLFAAIPIATGVTVVRLGGRLVSGAEPGALIEAAEVHVDTIAVGPELHLVLPAGNQVRFGNHSCDPNLGWADEYTLVTMRDVAAGTELTSDYATSCADPSFILPCHCETYRCRQLICGDDWRIPQLQQRYAGCWTPYLQTLIEG